MSLILFPVHLIAALAALLFSYGWFTQENKLEMTGATELTIHAEISRYRNRRVIAFKYEEANFYIACDAVRSLCDELSRRQIPQLRVWVKYAGLLHGDLMLQALEGSRMWVNVTEQQRRYFEMQSFYKTCLMTSWIVTIGVGFILYGKRKNAA